MTLDPEQLVYMPKPLPGLQAALRAWKAWRKTLQEHGYKPCAECRQVLELRFFREITNHRGPSSYCLSCENARQRRWQAEKKKTRLAMVAEEKRALVPAVAEASAETGIIEGDQSATLHRLTVKALLKLEQIIDMGLPDPNDSLFIKVVAEQRQAAQSIVQTQVRVDENVMRHKDGDRLTAVLEKIRQAARLIPADRPLDSLTGCILEEEGAAHSFSA